MNGVVIELNGLTKKFGDTVGIDGLSFEVKKGEVFGFLGPNGAGKTTTISLLVDLIRPTSGAAHLFGLDSVRDSLLIRRRIGFLASDFALDRGLSGWQQLEFFGALRGGFDKKYVSQLAERLACNLDRKFKTLSRGNKQKVGLITALMHKPELLILDEPTSGLDPIIQAEFNKIISEHRRRGGTTFISSHVLSEVQEICDRVAFIKAGKLIAVEDMKNLAKKSEKHLHITTRDKTLLHPLIVLPGSDVLKTGKGSIESAYHGPMAPLLKLLSEHRIDDLTISEADLETIFLKYYEDQDVK